MATITSTGTHTVISFSATNSSKTDANVPLLEDIDFDSSLKDTDWDELKQFVQIIADAYSISFHAATVLIEKGLLILKQRDVPTEQQRTYQQ